MNNLIATSRRGQMRALAVQGIFATDCHAQLRGLILRHLSPAHAALLAEPQHDAQKQGIDWYADLPGRPVRCADLPENEAQALRARAATLARDISETARRLRETSGHEHGLSGALLALVPLHATEDDLWSVDGQPVLINWGFAPGGPGAEAQDLTRLGSAPAPAPTPAVAAAAPVVPPVGGGRGCLWWLLPLLLLLLLLRPPWACCPRRCPAAACPLRTRRRWTRKKPARPRWKTNCRNCCISCANGRINAVRR